MTSISVIIPTFNRFQQLTNAIKSILNQTYKDFEIIVIDDGSIDETNTIPELFPNIRYYKTKNLGVSAARNLGVEKSNFEWIAFLDSDDEWLPHKLQTQIELIKKFPNIPLIHGEEIWVRNGKRVNQKNRHKKGGGDQFIQSLELCLISPSAVMLKKNIIENNNGFDESYPVCEDYDLWLKITSQFEIAFIEEPIIIKHGGHDDQLSRKYFAMDYWRVKSIHWILQNRELSIEKKTTAINILKSKSQILLNGYKKHNNLQNIEEIQKLFEFY